MGRYSRIGSLFNTLWILNILNTILMMGSLIAEVVMMFLSKVEWTYLIIGMVVSIIGFLISVFITISYGGAAREAQQNACELQEIQDNLEDCENEIYRLKQQIEKISRIKIMFFIALGA